MTWHLLIAVLLCVIVSACAGTPTLRSAEQFDAPIGKVARGCDLTGQMPSPEAVRLSHHVLVSDSEGSVPADRHHGSILEAFRTIMLGFAEAVQRNPDRPPRLLFYFNGGLSSQAIVEAQAARQVPCMIADGYYPVFFVWDTDGVASYTEQVTSVWDGQIDRSAYVQARAPFIVFGNVISGLGQAPADYFIHGRRFFRALRREPACSLVVRTDDLPVKCPPEQRVNFVDQTGTIDQQRNVLAAMDVDQHQREIGRFLAYSALWPVRLASTPLAHGLGEAAWVNMLRRTRTTIRRSVEFNLDRHADWDGDGIIDGVSKCPNDFREENRDYPRGTGAFASFFETILRYRLGSGPAPSKWRCDGDTERPEAGPTAEEAAKAAAEDQAITAALAHVKIALIGHSMGAIVINELLGRFPDLPYTDIVVMASAASLRDSVRVLDRYFEDQQPASLDTRFYSLMLHPLNDARERQYLGAVPSGSLLLWIDEMYDVPKTPEDKVFGFWPTAKAGRRMFGKAVQDRTLYRVFSRPRSAEGQPTNPVEHGHFNDDNTCFWRPSFWGVASTAWAERYRMALPAQALRPCGEKDADWSSG